MPKVDFSLNLRYESLDAFLWSHGLSRAEFAVAKKVLTGKPSEDIAIDLHLSSKTVKFHLTRIYLKFGVSNRARFILLCVPYLAYELKDSDIRKFKDAKNLQKKLRDIEKIDLPY